MKTFALICAVIIAAVIILQIISRRYHIVPKARIRRVYLRYWIAILSFEQETWTTEELYLRSGIERHELFKGDEPLAYLREFLNQERASGHVVSVNIQNKSDLFDKAWRATPSGREVFKNAGLEYHAVWMRKDLARRSPA